jgi:hypothetical protein
MKRTQGIRIIGGGCKAYLEFLRNLTPQILLLGFTIHVGKQLSFTSVDFSNWLQTLIFFVLLISFLFAFIINYSVFYNFALFRAVFLRRPLILIYIVFLTIFVNVVAAIVLISAVRLAASIMMGMEV